MKVCNGSFKVGPVCMVKCHHSVSPMEKPRVTWLAFLPRNEHRRNVGTCHVRHEKPEQAMILLENELVAQRNSLAAKLEFADSLIARVREAASQVHEVK